ncbi:MAG: hypothetical protein ACO3EE_02950 [Flavobacteriales bacterium]
MRLFILIILALFVLSCKKEKKQETVFDCSGVWYLDKTVSDAGDTVYYNYDSQNRISEIYYNNKGFQYNSTTSSLPYRNSQVYQYFGDTVVIVKTERVNSLNVVLHSSNTKYTLNEKKLAIKAETSPSNSVTTFTYDNDGFLVQESNPSSTINYLIQNGDIKQRLDQNGKILGQYTYFDEHEDKLADLEPWTGKKSKHLVKFYDSQNQVDPTNSRRLEYDYQFACGYIYKYSCQELRGSPVPSLNYYYKKM